MWYFDRIHPYHIAAAVYNLYVYIYNSYLFIIMVVLVFYVRYIIIIYDYKYCDTGVSC